VWLRVEQGRVELVVRLDVFLGEDRTAGGHPANERQAHLLAQRILELNTARRARHELEHAFFLQRAQVFLGRVRRPETQLARNLGTCRRHPCLADKLLNHSENFSLPGGQLAHFSSPV